MEMVVFNLKVGDFAYVDSVQTIEKCIVWMEIKNAYMFMHVGVFVFVDFFKLSEYFHNFRAPTCKAW